MKRLFAAILVLMMALSLCACGDSASTKFVGTWADETYTYTLTLDEEGGAVLKIGDTVFPSTVLSWEAQGFDTVVIKLDLAKYDFVFGKEEVKPEIPGYVELAPETETTEPEATAPEATEPEATEPEATAPEATTPEATEPEATAPEATTPEATEPEASEPEATEPEVEEEEKETKPAKRKGEIVIARLTLSISDGKMFLSLLKEGDKKAIALLVKLS